MNREECKKAFFEKKNSIGIDGYTNEELVQILSSKLFYLDDCPICNHKRLGRNSICGWCGFDQESDSVEVYKNEYTKILEDNSDYIFAIDGCIKK